MDYRKKYRVEPGERVKIKHLDPADTGKHADEAAARHVAAADADRLAKLQARLWAEQRRAVLIVLQAMDAGGKDGTVGHVFRSTNPEGVFVHAFKVPTAEEKAHDFLWREHRVTPAHGEIGIFNRSYYEAVLVERVHDLVPKKVWSKRYERINEFEKTLVQSGTVVLKFFLHISREEQLARFGARLDDPQKQWKISEADYAEREYWDDYMEAYEDAFEHCSTESAPWYLVPANHKWYRDLVVGRILVETLDEMDPRFPAPTVDLDEIRRRFHAAAQKAD
ncbi:MAG TPA: polyphosphate kinase 2 family protein [Candidatus Sulfotelmatobacter sp.]|nr:polyphosphate kinase 2 family protein [Candidatus Sulfotelmatobacter sp.]